MLSSVLRRTTPGLAGPPLAPFLFYLVHRDPMCDFSVYDYFFINVTWNNVFPHWSDGPRVHHMALHQNKHMTMTTVMMKSQMAQSASSLDFFEPSLKRVQVLKHINLNIQISSRQSSNHVHKYHM